MKKGWVYKKLLDVCDFQGGAQPPKSEWVKNPQNGYVRMLQIRDFTQSREAVPEYVKLTNKVRTCSCDDIMVGRYGASVGKILTGLAGAYNVALMKTLPDKDYLIKPYLRFYLLSNCFQGYLTSLGGRAAQAGFSKDDLANLSIALPPLSEQKEIVEYLDSSFAKIDKLKENAAKNLEEAKALFQSALKDALEPKEGWEEKTMDEVCILSQGLAINSKTKHLLVEKSSIPLLRIKDMKDGTREIFVDDKNYPPKCLAHPEELIYTRTGTLGLIFTGMFGIVHNNCFKIKLDEKILNKYYYMYFVGSDNFRNMILSIASRAAQPDITHKLFKVQKIQFPTLSEQQSIVSFLDSLNEKVNTLQQNYSRICNECDALKQAILRQVFE